MIYLFNVEFRLTFCHCEDLCYEHRRRGPLRHRHLAPLTLVQQLGGVEGHGTQRGGGGTTEKSITD